MDRLVPRQRNAPPVPRPSRRTLRLSLADLRELTAAASPVVVAVEGLGCPVVTVTRRDADGYWVFSDALGRVHLPTTQFETAFVVAGSRVWMAASR